MTPRGAIPRGRWHRDARRDQSPKVPPAPGLCPTVMSRVLQCSPFPLTALLPLLPSCAAPQGHPQGSSDAQSVCTKEPNPPGGAPAPRWGQKGPDVPFPAALALLPSSLWEQNQKLCQGSCSTHSPAVGQSVNPNQPWALQFGGGGARRGQRAAAEVPSGKGLRTLFSSVGSVLWPHCPLSQPPQLASCS